MSERTTIGGITYESIGSSSANLLLKCNGTARIQWGSKLIDLIKNGKIISEDSKDLIFIIKDKSEITVDGIYIIESEKPQFWVRKNGNNYDLIGTDLYISTNIKQNLTSEQKTQALNNIGVQYNTLQDLQNSDMQNGIAYIIDTKTLYTIKDGIIEEFSAKLKTITVDKEEEQGELINSPIKIVLSISSNEYLTISDEKINVHKPLIIKDQVQINSENYDKDRGYSLYVRNGYSFLDVDYINARREEKSIFYKGMIIMYTGNSVPTGWVLCDGKEYTFNDEKIITPNLINQFTLSNDESGIEIEIKKTETETEKKKYSIVFIIKL